MDVNGNVYSWGCNNYGQCGHIIDRNDITEPRRIGVFDDYVVEKVKVGWRHNYVKTDSGKHYIFGDNQGQWVSYIWYWSHY